MQSGIRPEMPLAEARSLLPLAEFLEHDPAADLAALRELCWWSHRYSPLVGLDIQKASRKRDAVPRPESLLLDTTGCDHLFGGEPRMARRIVHDLCECGLIARVSIADTIGAAWAAAHYAREQTTVIPPPPVPSDSETGGRGWSDQRERNPGESAPHVDRGFASSSPGHPTASFAALPVEALRLPAKLVETLHELDVRRIEQLLALPRESLPSRFGKRLLERLDQTLGLVDELIVHERPPEPVEMARSFEHPLTDNKAVEAVFNELISQLTVRLQEQSLGAQRVQCSVKGERDLKRFSVGFVRPSASAERLRELIELQLEQQVLPAEVVCIHLHAEELRPLGARQRLFFDDEGDAAELTVLLERMAGRLGEDAILRPQLQQEHQPELSVHWHSALTSGVAGAGRSEAKEAPVNAGSGLAKRPLFLRPQPVSLQVVSLSPESPPVRFQWDGVEYAVTRCRGPERIETGWWRQRHVCRDYYMVETSDGRRFWLFRERRSGAWFLHGEF